MLNIFGYILKLATLKFIDEFSKFIWVFVNSKFGTGNALYSIFSYFLISKLYFLIK